MEDVLAQYTRCPVEAVELPTFKLAGDERATVVIDGASGVGKTQQYFALARTKPACYTMLTVPNDESQLVYRRLAGESNFHVENFLDLARQALKVDDATKDTLSTAHLKERVLDLQARPPDRFREQMGKSGADKALVGLLRHICDKFGKITGDTLTISKELHDDASLESVLVSLQGKILFVDEALPETSFENLQLLRFVRNLGRAVFMHVVVCGTGATVANMLAAPAPGPARPLAGAASRHAIEVLTLWVRVVLLWQPVIATGFPQSKRLLDESDLQRHRPFLLHTLESLLNRYKPAAGATPTPRQLVNILVALGARLIEAKRLKENRSAMVAWLLGTWLQKEVVPSVALAGVCAPQLVKQHYFEPAVLVDSTLPDLVVSQCGRGNMFCRPGRCNIDVIHALQGWIPAIRKEQHDVEATACSSFDWVHKCLAVCVQQDLLREPLLALSLSTQHRLTVEEFQDGLLEYTQVSPAEWRLGAASGEAAEMTVYAACQLANGKKMMSPTPLGEYVRSLVQYLRPPAASDFSLHLSLEEKLALEEMKVAVLGSAREAQPLPMVRMLTQDQIHSYLQDAKKEKRGQQPGGEKKHTGVPSQDIPASTEPVPKRAKVSESDRQSHPEKPPSTASPAHSTGSPQKQQGTPPAPGLVDKAGGLARFVQATDADIEKVVVPWLVPAGRSDVDVPEGFNWWSKLFGSEGGEEIKVAGLVPVIQMGARCDLAVHDLPSWNVSWRIEVKARTHSYNMTQGVQDLVKKCDSTGDGGGCFHALLVALRGSEDSEVCYWKMKKECTGTGEETKTYIRGVVIIGNKPPKSRVVSRAD